MLGILSLISSSTIYSIVMIAYAATILSIIINDNFCIPACKYKNPETYNYLSLQAKKALEESISDLFRINMWNDLGDLADTSCKKMSAFRAWCTMHGIDVEYAETVRMKWYRMRKSYQNKGVNLFNHKRCRK